VHVTYGRGSVLLWRRSDTLCTSDFMDDIIFAHKPIKVARRRRLTVAQCTRSLGLGYKLCAVISVAGQQTHGTTFRALRVTSRWRWQQHRGRSLRSMTALFKLLDALIDGSRGGRRGRLTTRASPALTTVLCRTITPPQGALLSR